VAEVHYTFTQKQYTERYYWRKDRRKSRSDWRRRKKT